MTSPNILILMVDQLAGPLFPDGPAEWLHAPNLKRLAARSVRFAHAYTASPLCAPARAAFMSGQLPSRTGVYDNAAEFRSDIPTFAHHLRRAGYRTVLSGKMHFVGPDQMHGFEERLTTDIYPADFGWTPDYRRPGERIDWWYHNMGSVTGAGVAEITNQLEYDDAVAFNAVQKVYDLARGADARPWMMTVSFTHPHDPYVARKKHWDLYADCAHLAPAVAPIPYDRHDPHSQRIFDASDWHSYTITDEMVARSRRAYFANISYIDEKIGEILAAMEAVGQEAVIVFVSDHGDMLGERGLWFKMNFFDHSAAVPLMIAVPGLAPHRVDQPVSTLDVNPTLCALAGIPLDEVAEWMDGVSLLPLATGTGGRPAVPMEYAAEASEAPLVGLRKGRWKLVLCQLDPDMLFDMEADPHELHNLAADPDHAATLAELKAEALARWDLARFDAEVRASQARRWVVYEALRNGAYFPWDFQPLQKASEQYMRNHMDLNVLEGAKRFPEGRVMQALVPSQPDLAAAFAVTRRATQRTPLIESEALARASGATRVFVKAESLQSTGSFKIRGAFWRLWCLTPEERARGVVAFSSGNFAQGLAAAGRSLGVPVTIVMPFDAPALKREATEGYGARVILSQHGERPREEVASALARDIAAREGLVLLHPFDDPLIVAGQAGAGLEALEQLADLGATVDVAACPVGGGGLLGGVALALHYSAPRTRIWAVEPEGYNGMGLSLAAGEMRRVAGGGRTISDALQATAPGTAPLAAARAAGVGGVAMDDAAVARAMRFAFERLKLVLEPSGAVALAAVLEGAIPVAGRNVLIFATGGNVALDRFVSLVGTE